MMVLQGIKSLEPVRCLHYTGYKDDQNFEDSWLKSCSETVTCDYLHTATEYKFPIYFRFFKNFQAQAMLKHLR